MSTYTSLDGTSYNVTGDPQQKKVYRWEQEVVAHHDTSLLSLEESQEFVDFLWVTEGHNHPPKVRHPRTRQQYASGSRLEIVAPATMLRRWILIHEAAHSFTSNVDGASNHHGPAFMKVLFELLEKHMHLSILVMMHTARKHGIEVDGYVPKAKDNG